MLVICLLSIAINIALAFRLRPKREDAVRLCRNCHNFFRAHKRKCPKCHTKKLELH